MELSKLMNWAPLLALVVIYFVFLRPKVDAVDLSALKQKAAANQVTIIDVREKDEVESGMLKDALWMPLSNWSAGDEQVNRLISQIQARGKASEDVYVYCRSGARSGKVAAILKSKGINAKNLGGFSGLESAGFSTKKL